MKVDQWWGWPQWFSLSPRPGNEHVEGKYNANAFANNDVQGSKGGAGECLSNVYMPTARFECLEECAMVASGTRVARGATLTQVIFDN